MRIILYKGSSQYGALRMHIDRLAQAFGNIGHEAIVIDFEDPNALTRLEEELNIGCNFVFAINCIIADLKIGEELLYNLANITYITALVDHPLYHMKSRLDTNINKFVVTCLDKKHLVFLSEQYEENHFLSKSFLVPGGSQSPRSKEESFDEFLTNRHIDMLFTGSFRGIPRKSWSTYENKSLSHLMDDICEYVLSNDYVLVEDAFEQVLKDKNLEFSYKHKNQRKLFIMQVLKEYIASYKRYKCLETLAQEGVPIDIYGTGWEDWAVKYNNIRYHETGTVQNTLDILTKTKLCLNINNSFVAGGHERVFNSMINGAPVISDKSLFYNEVFEEGKDIITYSWTKLNDLPGQVNEYLKDNEKLWEISQNARKKVLERFTWEHKAEQIIELYELAN